ncbi:MAG: aspartate carbamoyltransferase [bacterium]|nr:aspartate carbamoyltransferase [bacterium]
MTHAKKRHGKPQEQEEIEPFNGTFLGKDVISVDQFTSKKELELLFLTADKMRKSVESKAKRKDLEHRTVAELFYQPSTRTFTSFQAAAKWLGCPRVIAIPGMEAYSSAVKGESLEDTIRTIEQTTAADLIILRHPDDDSAEKAAQIAQIPVVNAGSGKREHPTQGILDLYTIRQELGRIDNLHVVMLGDLKQGRTVKSLSKLLALAGSNIKITFVSPTSLKMPEEIIKKLVSRGVEIHETENLDNALPQADILYVTRIQKEWFEKEDKMSQYQKLVGIYTITPDTLKSAKQNMVLMHPLPRVGEISYEVDSDPRAAYFRQMRYGLYTRMALLSLILGENKTTRS